MASCLYECLCEAELEKYYPHFIALGFERIDELAKVSMKDYAKLGVHNMKDRKRLFQLVRIIKMLQAEEEAVGKSQPYLQSGAVYLQPPLTRSGPRRQLHFDSPSEERDGGREHESGSCTLSSCSVNEDKDDLAAVLSHDSEYKIPRKDSPNVPATWAEYKQGNAAISSSNDIGPLLGDTEAPIVQRIAHVSGYNYGVPHSCIRPAEKEMPWTETDRICVCVRKRPLGLREERRGEVNILTVEGKETLLLHEKKEAVDLTQYILQHVFYFDEVFGETCSNQDVYMKTAHPLIQHIFNGGNATCFAYGQTGAGKTYTMIGTHQNPGLYALAAKDIFQQLEASQNRQDLHVWISFYEIYCGQLYDLLNGRKRLFAREDSKHVVQIVGLREVQVNTVSLLLEVILKGGKERSTGATGVNSDSSRSHAVIQIQIKDAANRVFGRISFIDLAGSERAADARDSDRQTKMEGAEINQSLLALKECIRALDQEHAHTPFRQSKLTQVLKDSFVGNSKTCMIANVSPSHVATEHTLNTLRYADRVKELKRGMKCCTPVANRRLTTGSTSPKRIQSSPRTQVGEKSSPKKVKLGVQRPPVLTAFSRMKASSLLAHPGQPPFSSTPKGQARKGQVGAQWLGRASPVKGALRAAKATAEGPARHSEKSHVGKDLAAGKEGGQGDAQQGKCPKAQPVRKQLIPRADFPLGDAHPALAHEGDGGRQFAEQRTAAWTGLPPHQRDREQHLHLYHQQFQQPPLLQQKLNYQPLERFLAQYKPQGLQVKREAPCQTPGSPQHCDATMQLDELDDSDFSDDSFSPGPSQRKAQAEGQGDCSQGSFFLHQRECGAGSPEVQDEHELFSELGNKGTALPGEKEASSCEEGRKNRPDWSREEASAPPQRDTPEKPYCSQEDSAGCNRTSPKGPLAGQNPSQLTGLPRSGKRCSVPEEAAHSPPFADPLGSTKTIADSLAEGSSHGPLSGMAGGRGLQEETGLSAGQDCSVGFASGGMAPLTVTFLDVGTSDTSEEDQSQPWEGKAFLEEEEEEEEESSTERKPVSPTKHWDYEDTREFCGNNAPSLPSVYERDQWRRNTGQVLSPQARPKWLSQSCHSPKAASPRGVASALNELHGCVCGYSAEDAGLAGLPSPCTDEGSSVRLHNLQFSEYVSSPYYDADAEATAVAPLSCSGQFSLGEDDSMQPRVLLQHIDMVEQAFVSSTLSISDHAGRKDSPTESTLPQSRVAFGKLELGHAREGRKVAFSHEEVGLLTNRCTQNLFPHPPEAVQQDPGLVSRGISIAVAKESSKACGQRAFPDRLLPFKGTLERQFVLQIHREQLDEMAGLCFQEESLIRKMSALDFEDFVMQLDTILMLKSKCIQKMQSQLQPFLTAASSGAALLTASLT